FFQAEDGIRDDLVTGVQTCALPISGDYTPPAPPAGPPPPGDGGGGPVPRPPCPPVCTSTTRAATQSGDQGPLPRVDYWAIWNEQIGRASCRERGEMGAVRVGGNAKQ